MLFYCTIASSTFTGTPTNSYTDDGETPPGLPLALLFSFGVIGALFLLMIILMGVMVACCMVKKRWTDQDRPPNVVAVEVEARAHQVLVNTNVEQSVEHAVTPNYSKVVKLPAIKKSDEEEDGSSPPPPLPPPPVFETPSPKPIAIKPQEIASYNLDLPKMFSPYAPPPPVNGLASRDNLHKVCTDESPYNIPVDSLADYDEVDSFDGIDMPVKSLRKPARAYSFKSYSQPSPSDDESYYDTVESVQEERSSPALTSSLQMNHSQSHYQSPRRRPGRYSQGNNTVPSFEPTYFEALEPSMLHLSLSSIGSETPLPYAPIYDSPRVSKWLDQPLEISCHNIMEIQNLGIGRFGPVVLAATVNLSLKDLKLGDNSDKDRSFLVAVKKQKNDAGAATKTAFQEEIRFLSKIKHANVVRLLGVCSKNSLPFIIVEYMENGDLNQFLHKQKLVPDNTQHLQDGEATPLILLYMAVQISSGMRYLASKKFIHRDLATRNCLVGREFVVKISDFGMSQNLYESYYYRVQGQLILPIRWMPYESFYGKFSIKSDVWSFGVTLWEIYHMAGREPYADMTDQELINNATKGKKRSLLKRPEICPQEVYDVLLRCWVHEPSVRADFEEIYSRLFLTYMTKSQEASY